MTVTELIDCINAHKLDPDTKIELADGSSVDELCYNSALKRLSISTLDDSIPEENLAEGWRYIVQHE